jgi:glycosyltransferase involved in cell wall biosynthesis
MHIGLNLLYAHPAIGGAWRYIQNVLHMIRKYDQRNSYSLFLYGGNPLPLAALSARMQLHFIPGSANTSRWRRVLDEQIEIPRMAESEGCVFVHSFGNVAVMRRGIRNLVTVHDLKPYERNEGILPSARDVYVRTVLPTSLRISDFVLPISHFTAAALQRRFRIEARKVIPVPNVVDDRFYPRSGAETASLREHWHLPHDFWLYVANYYPHKNHERLLLAYDRYRRSGKGAWPLVLCGAPALQYGRIRGLVSRLGLEADVYFVHGLCDDEMPALYSAASALIFPSQYEGFGIPLLEAMACACPIAASDIAAVRELTAPGVIRFHPRSVESMASAMLRVQQDAGLRAALAEAGQKTAERYRDRVVIEQLMDAYERGGKA